MKVTKAIKVLLEHMNPTNNLTLNEDERVAIATLQDFLLQQKQCVENVSIGCTMLNNTDLVLDDRNLLLVFDRSSGVHIALGNCKRAGPMLIEAEGRLNIHYN